MVEAITNKYFNNLSHIKHAFFTRNGGVSKGIFESLNVNNNIDKGEDFSIVEQNLNIIKNYFSKEADLMRIKQVSGSKVITISNRSDISNNYEADAIVTNLNNLVIGVSTADCIPILLSDKVKKIIGVTHAGWRGALYGIVQNTITEMKKFGATEIIATIGPHLRVENFEVKDDFIEILKNKNISEKKYIKVLDKNKYFNLTNFAIDILKSNNIINIYDNNLDSFNDESKFFSYRRGCHRGEKRYGGNFSGIMIC